MESRGEDYNERLIAGAARLRDSGRLGRSDPLIRLFDYLLESSLAGRIPKEIEIAQEVFGKDSNFDIMQDASVRVYIHRLRRKLEDFNTKLAPEEDRILLPLGEYQLTLARGAEPEAPAVNPDEAGPEPELLPEPARKPRLSRFWIVAGLFLLVNAGGWLAYPLLGGADPSAAIVRSPVWQPIARSRNPSFIVGGDYYIFGDSPDTFNVSRLVRDFSINSRDELDVLRMTNPYARDHYLDLDLSYLPVSIGPALRELLPVATSAGSKTGVRPQVTRMSQVTPEMLKNTNVIYVGFLSGLGILRDPLFRASGFKIGGNYDELIDKANGRRFDSDWAVVADGKTPQRDYAYIASIPGPSGNRIMIISGTRDAAVAQAAQIMVDPEQLAEIAAKTKGDAFEALYEVRTLGSVNLSSSLIVARPIRSAGIWHPEEMQRR
ncbi:hypothetical protein WSK_2930 [Novosphingobium sp. Rr 2-17]|uniref:helix-turn-helix domain-containing protein n=1 Tax=Novosphingobium sp. Rr 2-17 TaxID=555793 RepID=UPI000269A20E|nr:helix-turn-helix domain-containing protein [Novosphingobium sp. Rr 2-17]EIZ78486.1 hypothetical protein WSK_2930 [Novosphingobium sp. Rr 2-17]